MTASAPGVPLSRSMEFDLVVIGGGSGGLAGAFRAARYGARVALLEPCELGGTCVNRGCVPKKAMWLAADLARKIGLAARVGFDVPPPALDWSAFVAHRQGYIAGILASYRQRLDASGIVLMPTRGRLASPTCVETEQGVTLRAGHVLIATGGHPRVPAIPGAGLGVVSDDFFHLRSAPERVAIVGGGHIAAELAGVLQALGSRVELFVRGQRCWRSSMPTSPPSWSRISGMTAPACTSAMRCTRWRMPATDESRCAARRVRWAKRSTRSSSRRGAIRTRPASGSNPSAWPAMRADMSSWMRARTPACPASTPSAT